MAEESAKLRIPYIAGSQAQKHVTHNEAMTLLDTLVQLSVIDKDLTAPPGAPEEGDTYIVAASATGAWEGWDHRVARYIDGTWRSYLPGEGGGAGWLAFVLDEALLYRFNGSAWVRALESFQPDAVVNAIAGRAAHNGEAAAFSVLVLADAGNDGKPTLYFKLSAGSGDWSSGITWLPEGGLALDDLEDVAAADPAHGDVLRFDAGEEEWVNHDASGWTEVEIGDNQAMIDIALGDKFLIEVDEDCELQVPDNAVPGAPFAIRVLMAGSHEFTFAPGWLGAAPHVLTGDGDETLLAGLVLDTDPLTTAIANQVKAIPAT